MLMPEGFHYWPQLISEEEEAALLDEVSSLEFNLNPAVHGAILPENRAFSGT
jgi:hypothetical protein